MSRNLAIALFLGATLSLPALAGGFSSLAAGGGTESNEGHAPSMGRGAAGNSNQGGQQNQEQDTFAQLQQQAQQMQQANTALIQKTKESLGRAADNKAAAETFKQVTGDIAKASDKAGEELKKNTETFIQGATTSQPKEEGIKKEVGDAFKALSTPQNTAAITTGVAGVIADIQALNALQVGYIAEIAKAFTAPARPAPVANKTGPDISSQVASSGLTASTNPGNIFAQALSQQSPASVPTPHSTGQGFMDSTVRNGAMRGLSSETLYNAPAGVTLPK